MKKMTSISTAFFCLFLSINLSAQQESKFKENEKDKNGNTIFAELSVPQPSNFQADIKLLKELLALPETISFQLLKDSIIDQSGMVHKVYQQYYKNIKVIGGDYAFHVGKGYVHFLNGAYLDIKNEINVTPSLSIPMAEILAENSLREKNKSVNSSVKLKSEFKELVIIEDPLTKEFRLALKIYIEAVNDMVSENEFIDAVNGRLILTENIICAFLPPNATGSAQTTYSGTQTIITDVVGNQFRMREVQNGVSINTYNGNYNTSFSATASNAIDIFDNDNNWQAFEHGNDRVGYDVHWAAEKSYAYWLNVHGRNSINGAGMNINSYFHFRLNEDNAYWDNGTNSMYFGDGFSIFRPLGSLDACAHEFGHGISKYTVPGGGFGLSGESPALNEGFSDIWGASVESWAAPAKQRWLIGEEIMNNGTTCLRNMQNPKSATAQTHGPDTYQKVNWSNSNDAHINATVLGHWYYLLTTGGSGTNDNGNFYSVSGIGITKAEKIAYRTEQLLNPSANYGLVRAMSVQAANELYGQYSAERCAVENAWYAVGVGGLPSNPLSLSITGDWFVCPNGSTTYTLTGVPSGGNVTWAVSNPSIASVTANGNQATVSSIGDGNVTLTATVSNGNCWTNNVAYRYISIGQEAVNLMSNIIGLNPPLGVSPGELLELDVAAVPNTPVQWSVEGGTIQGVSTNSHVTIQVDQCPPNISNGYINVHCTFTHLCGTGTYTEWTTVDCSTGGGPARISPNPANSSATVDLLGPGKTIKEIKITNKMGNLVRQIRYSGFNKRETIDISLLPSDIYYVEVFDGKTWIGIHLSVRH